jgi:hypothetical protein
VSTTGAAFSRVQIIAKNIVFRAAFNPLAPFSEKSAIFSLIRA